MPPRPSCRFWAFRSRAARPQSPAVRCVPRGPAIRGIRRAERHRFARLAPFLPPAERFHYGRPFGTLSMSLATTQTPRSYWPANGLSAIVDFSVHSHRRAVLLLVLLSFLAFLPGFFAIPPVDRDEAYFAQATKQMIETGDYVDIRYQGDLRYRKPIGIYWLQAAAVNTARALGLRRALTTIWLYRLPSLLGAIGAVLATYWCA